MIILGLDPGVASTGWGVIKSKNNPPSDEWQVISYGCIKTAPHYPQHQRLKVIFEQTTKLIKKYRPSLIAVEELFFYKNAKTALKVGEARGVILLTVIQSKIPFEEFTPLQIKQAITGYGRAQKHQIQKMVQVLLNLKNIPQSDDAADALAVALCSSQTYRTYQSYQSEVLSDLSAL